MLQLSPVPITKALHWGDRFISSLMRQHRTLLTEVPSYHWRSPLQDWTYFVGCHQHYGITQSTLHCPQSGPSMVPDSLVPPFVGHYSLYWLHNLDFLIMPCHCDHTVHHQFRDTCSHMLSNVVVYGWHRPQCCLKGLSSFIATSSIWNSLPQPHTHLARMPSAT